MNVADIGCTIAAAASAAKIGATSSHFATKDQRHDLPGVEEQERGQGHADNRHLLEDPHVGAAKARAILLKPAEGCDCDWRQRRGDLLQRQQEQLVGAAVETELGGAPEASNQEVVEVTRPVVEDVEHREIAAEAEQVAERGVERRPHRFPVDDHRYEHEVAQFGADDTRDKSPRAGAGARRAAPP